MEIKIEKNIPLAAIRRKGTISEIVRLLEIGDSFQCYRHQANSARQTALHAKIGVATRKIGDDLYRVWRTS